LQGNVQPSKVVNRPAEFGLDRVESVVDASDGPSAALFVVVHLSPYSLKAALRTGCWVSPSPIDLTTWVRHGCCNDVRPIVNDSVTHW
jgi:hypothetical protein